MERKWLADASSDIKEIWVYPNLSCEDAASLLVGQPNGTFIVTMGPAPIYATISVVLDRTVRHVAVARMLPRGLTSYHPISGEIEEFSLARDFIRAHRDIFRYNYSERGVPRMDVASSWNKEYLALTVSTEMASSAGVAVGGGEFEAEGSVFALCGASYPDAVGGWSVICDHVACELYSTRCWMVLTDGCGFGGRARLASVTACRAFLEFVRSLQFCATTTDMISHGLLGAVRHAHSAVLASSDPPENAGTTTLLGGGVFKMENGEPDEWTLVLVSIGDVKCYVIHDGKVREPTMGNRGNVDDASDPGGRIGPQIGLLPDTRNLKCYFTPVCEGDIVMIASDGVHDDFDPEACGISNPSTLSDSVVTSAWNNLSGELATRLKSQWGCDRMNSVLSACASKADTSVTGLSPEQVVRGIYAYCRELTAVSRRFMQDNPHRRLPSDYSQYPGKMDHCSMIAYRVGVINGGLRLVSDVASFRPRIVERAFDSPLSPPGSPGRSPPLSPTQQRPLDQMQLLRLRAMSQRDGNSRVEQLALFCLDVIEYSGLNTDDERRPKADVMILEHFHELSPLVCEDKFAQHARSVLRYYMKLSSGKVSAVRTNKTTYATLFEKIFHAVLTQLGDHYAARAHLMNESFPVSGTQGWPSRPGSGSGYASQSNGNANNHGGNSNNNNNRGGDSLANSVGSSSSGSTASSPNIGGPGAGPMSSVGTSSSNNGNSLSSTPTSGGLPSTGGGVNILASSTGNLAASVKLATRGRKGGRLRSVPNSLNESVAAVPSVTLEDLLSGNFCSRMLVVGERLGYEAPLRFVVLEKEFRREKHDKARRWMLASELCNHFIVPTAKMPVRISLGVRRAIILAVSQMRAAQPAATSAGATAGAGGAGKGGSGGNSPSPGNSASSSPRNPLDCPLDLFAPAVVEVMVMLQEELYPSLLAQPDFMADLTQFIAVDRLNHSLMRAVSEGDDKEALACIECGADVDFVDHQGWSALLTAAWMGNYKLCLDLLRHGAYVNQETHDHSNIWHMLAAGPHSEDAQRTLFVWANDLRALLRRLHEVAIVRPSSTNLFKETALHVAVLSKAPLEFIRFLCEKCNCPNLMEIRNASGETAYNYGERVKAPADVLEYLAPK